MAKHSTSVVQISKVQYQPKCSCGWWGYITTRGGAEQQARDHKSSQ